MRIPVAWLREYCDPGMPAEEIADLLTMAGDKLERLHRVGVGDPNEFVVGKVLTAEQHPDADRLTVCTVDIGAGDPSTIVCGAPNVAAGQTVAVARPGAIMPDGTKLGEAKLRGVKSSGMILAEDEVGIGEDHHGTMVLDDSLPVGAPLAEHLPIADEVLEIEITPNRPDIMSVYGVARDLHTVTAAPLAEDPTERDAEPSGDDSADDHASVEIDPEICLRFTARVFEDVKIGPSPLWLKQRLMAAGQRPISNVVDITNYVMLTTGQPLHAFDLDKVRGKRIIVRRAREGETMTTLDGVERTFSDEVALVCDAEGASGIAGVMGGLISEVSDSTTRVLMEAATWIGANIMRTSKALGLRSEASARFEKQLHPEQGMAAQRLAARLMVELCGARWVPGTIDVYPDPPEPRVVPLRPERMEKLLGERIEEETASGILNRLGFVYRGERGWGQVGIVEGEHPAGVEIDPPEAGHEIKWQVPPWRDSDVQREADLIEEVARIHGLDKLPTTLPARGEAIGRLTGSQPLRRRLEDLLRDRGLLETISYSFTSHAKLARLRLTELEPLRIENPLSEEHSAMRPLLLPGLLDAAQHNAAHGRPGIALFESGHVYLPAGPLEPAPEGSPGGATPADEHHHLGALLTEAAPTGWRTSGHEADFFATKGLLEAILEAAGVKQWRLEDAALRATAAGDAPAAGGESAARGGRPFLHPGRAGVVVTGEGVELGWIGELHPLVLREWELQGPAGAFELNADLLHELTQGRIATYSDVTSFPAVLQDIAVIVPEDVPAARLAEVVRAGAGDLLAALRIFDLYHGEQVGEGSKSLALRLEFRAPDRTLTDEEVTERRAEIERELESIGGHLRA
jgi:phenylalanyl-tRNA synthetase beta chain